MPAPTDALAPTGVDSVDSLLGFQKPVAEGMPSGSLELDKLLSSQGLSSLDTQKLPDYYERHGKLKAAKDAAEARGESTATVYRRKYMPFGDVVGTNWTGIGGRVVGNKEYADATSRFAQGKSTDDDLQAIAAYENAKSIDKRAEKDVTLLGSQFAGKLALELGNLGKIGGEMAAFAGPVGRVAGLTRARPLAAAAGAAPAVPVAEGLLSQGLRAAPGVVAGTAAAPSMYVPMMQQQNMANGRDPNDLRGLPTAFGYGVANMAVLGKLQGGLHGSLNPVKAFTNGVLGMAELQGVDAAAGAIDQFLPKAYQIHDDENRWGTLGQFVKGYREKGVAGLADPLEHATIQALSFAGFGLAHSAVEGKPDYAGAEDFTKTYANAVAKLRESGLSRKEAGKKVGDLHDKLEEGLKANPYLDRSDARSLLEKDVDPALRDYADRLADVFDPLARPDKPLPEDAKTGPAKPPEPAAAAAGAPPESRPVPGETPRPGDSPAPSADPTRPPGWGKGTETWASPAPEAPERPAPTPPPAGAPEGPSGPALIDRIRQKLAAAGAAAPSSPAAAAKTETTRETADRLEKEHFALARQLPDLKRKALAATANAATGGSVAESKKADAAHNKAKRDIAKIERQLSDLRDKLALEGMRQPDQTAAKAPSTPPVEPAAPTVPPPEKSAIAPPENAPASPAVSGGFTPGQKLVGKFGQPGEVKEILPNGSIRVELGGVNITGHPDSIRGYLKPETTTESTPEPAAAATPAAPAARPQHDYAVVNIARKSLEAATHLDAETREKYRASFEKVIDAMPDEVKARLSKNVENVAFYKLPHEAAIGNLNEWLSYPDLTLEQRSNFRRMIVERENLEVNAVGAFNIRSRTLHIDGQAGGELSGRYPLNTPEVGGAKNILSREQIYAHEFGHALDGHDGTKWQNSDSQQWKRAFHEEFIKKLPDGRWPLTEYATKSPSEAFAEFNRILSDPSIPTSQIARDFKQASLYFKSKGWWPAERGPAEPPKARLVGRELFTQRVEGPKDEHVDETPKEAVKESGTNVEAPRSPESDVVKPAEPAAAAAPPEPVFRPRVTAGSAPPKLLAERRPVPRPAAAAPETSAGPADVAAAREAYKKARAAFEAHDASTKPLTDKWNRVRADHPDWTDEQLDAERDRIDAEISKVASQAESEGLYRKSVKAEYELAKANGFQYAVVKQTPDGKTEELHRYNTLETANRVFDMRAADATRGHVEVKQFKETVNEFGEKDWAPYAEAERGRSVIRVARVPFEEKPAEQRWWERESADGPAAAARALEPAAEKAVTDAIRKAVPPSVPPPRKLARKRAGDAPLTSWEQTVEDARKAARSAPEPDLDALDVGGSRKTDLSTIDGLATFVARSSKLTDAEKKYIIQRVNGKTTVQIAAETGVSKQAVEQRSDAGIQKLGFKDFDDLMSGIRGSSKVGVDRADEGVRVSSGARVQPKRFRSDTNQVIEGEMGFNPNREEPAPKDYYPPEVRDIVDENGFYKPKDGSSPPTVKTWDKWDFGSGVRWGGSTLTPKFHLKSGKWVWERAPQTPILELTPDKSEAEAWIGADKGKTLEDYPGLDNKEVRGRYLSDAQLEHVFGDKIGDAGEVDWRPTETIPEDFYAEVQLPTRQSDPTPGEKADDLSREIFAKHEELSRLHASHDGSWDARQAATRSSDGVELANKGEFMQAAYNHERASVGHKDAASDLGYLGSRIAEGLKYQKPSADFAAEQKKKAALVEELRKKHVEAARLHEEWSKHLNDAANHEAVADQLLKRKEQGNEPDWRHNESLPEDFYAMLELKKPVEKVFDGLKEKAGDVPGRLKRFFFGGLDAASRAAKEQELDQRIAAHSFDVSNNAKDLRAALREAGTPYEKLSKDQLANLDDILRVPPREILAAAAKVGIMGKVADVLVKMRRAVDDLSYDLISTGAIDAPLVAAVEGNIGTYLTRQYEVFKNPNWYKVGKPGGVEEAVVNRFKSWLYEELKAEYGEKGASEVDLDAYTKSLLVDGTAAENPINFLSKSRLGSKDLSILKKRKDIPDELRALWGEYRDPLVNYTNSVGKMSNLLANHLFLTRVAGEGLGTIFFEKPTGDAVVKIAAEGSDTMRPLNGLYTTPELKRAFDEVFKKSELPEYLQLYMKALSAAKFSKIILSHTGQLRNFFSNVGLAVRNGYFGGSLTESFKTLAKDSEENRAKWRRLIELGVVGEELNYRDFAATVDDALGGRSGSVGNNVLSRFLSGSKDFAEKWYRYGDSYWKVYAFENEMQRYRKAFPDMPQDALEKKVAQIVRDTMPTYSKVPEGVKSLRRLPFVAPFVSFQAEVVRTTVNNFRQMVADLKSPETRSIGFQRLAGMAAAAILPTAAALTLRSLQGIDAEEDKAVRRFLPDYQKESMLLYVGRDEKGRPRYIDGSRTDPHAYLSDALFAFVRAKSSADGLKAVTDELTKPFTSEELLARPILDVARNKKEPGGQVYNPADTTYQKATDVAGTLADPFKPGAYGPVKRLAMGLTGATEQKSGKDFEAGASGVENVTGQRPEVVRVEESLANKARGFSAMTDDAAKISNQLIRAKGSVSPEELAAAASRTNAGRKDAFDELREDVQAAERLNVPRAKIIRLLKEAGLSAADMASVVGGSEVRSFRPKLEGPLQERQRAVEVMKAGR